MNEDLVFNIALAVIVGFIILSSIFLGSLALIVCGSLHIANGAFDITNGGAIAMVVVGSVLMLWFIWSCLDYVWFEPFNNVNNNNNVNNVNNVNNSININNNKN